MPDLIAHPAHPPKQVRRIEARVTGRDAQWLRLRWRVEGAGALVVPPFAGKGRADGLWQSTCFELFVQPGRGPGYVEFNLSPSERWNAYCFDDRREAMREWAIPREPQCTLRLGTDLAIFDAALPVAGLPPLPARLGLTAVIEEQGGVKSYWSLAHGGDAPDFHDPACFLDALAAPEAP